MGAFIVYLIKAAVCLLFFFMFSKLVFWKDTMHSFTRFIWIIIVPISFLLPLFHFEVWSLFEDDTLLQGLTATEFNTVFSFSDASIITASTVNPTYFSIVKWFSIVYFSGVLLIGLYFLISYIRLFLQITINRGIIEISKEYSDLLEMCKNQVNCHSKVHLIILKKSTAPFSWMNYIFISNNDLLEDGREILIHELSHIKGGHSWDILLMDLLIVFQWFNPASWLTKRSIQQVHEYYADESVIESGIDAKSYQLLLIKKAVGQRLYTMANSFNHSKLKNRITMMLKKKSTHWAYAKCLYAIPIAFFAISAFTAPELSAQLNELSGVKITQNSQHKDTIIISGENQPLYFIDGKEVSSFGVIKAEDILSISVLKDEAAIKAYGERAKNGVILVKSKNNSQRDALENPIPFATEDIIPTFQGGDINAFSAWVGKNLVYPKIAKEKGIQGRVILQFTITTTGDITDVKVLRGIDKSLDEEAVRVVSSSPKWECAKQDGLPVAVTYNFPIVFSLAKD